MKKENYLDELFSINKNADEENMPGKEYTLNLKDRSGCIRSGYQSKIVAASQDDAIAEYLYEIQVLQGIEEVTEADVDIEEN